jgi:hypothetical protein
MRLIRKIPEGIQHERSGVSGPDAGEASFLIMKEYYEEVRKREQTDGSSS